MDAQLILFISNLAHDERAAETRQKQDGFTRSSHQSILPFRASGATGRAAGTI